MKKHVRWQKIYPPELTVKQWNEYETEWNTYSAEDGNVYQKVEV